MGPLRNEASITASLLTVTLVEREIKLFIDASPETTRHLLKT